MTERRHNAKLVEIDRDRSSQWEQGICPYCGGKDVYSIPSKVFPRGTGKEAFYSGITYVCRNPDCGARNSFRKRT